MLNTMLKLSQSYIFSHYSCKPWRSIDELKESKDTYKNAFIEIQHVLSDALKYHDNYQKIQEAIENAQKLVQ